MMNYIKIMNFSLKEYSEFKEIKISIGKKENWNFKNNLDYL